MEHIIRTVDISQNKHFRSRDHFIDNFYLTSPIHNGFKFRHVTKLIIRHMCTASPSFPSAHCPQRLSLGCRTVLLLSVYADNIYIGLKSAIRDTVDVLF